MGFFTFLYELTKPNAKAKKQKCKTSKWETHCESCGELLEDCECDWQNVSQQDINKDMDDLDFDEMNDVWDEMDDF